MNLSPLQLARAHYVAAVGGRLPMWVVYRPTTSDYPGLWVARMHLTLPKPEPTRLVVTHRSLEELREMLPEGLTRMGRDQWDLPVVEEVWI